MVPTHITDEVNLLLNKMSLSGTPVYVPCKHSPFSPQNECFPLVEARVNAEGGEQILGWQIWQGQLLVEAEFHAIWKSPRGELVDITPKARPFEKILFIEEPSAIYEGKQVDNIRMNISGNSLVDELIAVWEAVFRIENKGDRAFQYELRLTGKEADAHSKLNAAKLMLEFMNQFDLETLYSTYLKVFFR